MSHTEPLVQAGQGHDPADVKSSAFIVVAVILVAAALPFGVLLVKYLMMP